MATIPHSPGLGQVPPHSDEAERGVLGCILLAPADCLAEAAAITPEYFYDLRHRLLFTAMRALGDKLDSISLTARLKGQKKIQEAGGVAYFSSLPDSVPSAANLPFYLKILREKFIQRRIAAVCSDVANRAVNHAGDLDELLFSVNADLAGLAELQREKNGLPAMVDAAAFTETELIAPPELVQGVLHQGCKLSLGGGSKTFKTFVLTDLGVSVSHGEPWLSFKTKQAPVCFLNFELQPWAMQIRLAAIAKAKGIKLKPGSFHIWNLRGHATDYRDLLPRLGDAIGVGRFGLVILDPIYKLYGSADENSARDISAMLNQFERLAQDTGAAIAFAAHFAKGNAANKESIDRISGSGVFARDPDSIVTLTRHQEENAFIVDATLRNHPILPPFVCQWSFPLLRRADGLDPAKIKEVRGRKQIHTTDKLLSCLAGNALTTSEWQKRASSEKGVPKTQFYELLEEAKRNPGVTQNTDGQWIYDASTAQKT